MWQFIAGLPWLGSLIVGIFTAVANFFLQFLTRKFAFQLIGVALIATVTVGFFAALESLISGIASAAPAELNMALSLVVPGNFTQCAAAVLSGHLLRLLYSWKVRFIEMKAPA